MLSHGDASRKRSGSPVRSGEPNARRRRGEDEKTDERKGPVARIGGLANLGPVSSSSTTTDQVRSSNANGFNQLEQLQGLLGNRQGEHKVEQEGNGPLRQHLLNPSSAANFAALGSNSLQQTQDYLSLLRSSNNNVGLNMPNVQRNLYMNNGADDQALQILAAQYHHLNQASSSMSAPWSSAPGLASSPFASLPLSAYNQQSLLANNDISSLMSTLNRQSGLASSMMNQPPALSSGMLASGLGMQMSSSGASSILNPSLSLNFRSMLARSDPTLGLYGSGGNSSLYGASLPTLGVNSFSNLPQLSNTMAMSTSHAFANTGLQAQSLANIPARLPVPLAHPDDTVKLSHHQVLLRQQIEAFSAGEEDVSTHTRGRNKPVTLGQVGIRCRHCAHLPVSRRQKGSTYFPATLLGVYQAAQNMSTTHMQCGLCTEMPDEIKEQFVQLMTAKVITSGAGRPYWAQSARKLGLVDTEEGIRFIRDIPQSMHITNPNNY